MIIIIITLFMSQVYLAEHRGSTNWGDRKSNQIKCWFLVRGENRSTRGKTSRSRVENQQTQPTYDVRSGNRTRATLVRGQCSQHCANTALKTKDSVEVLQLEKTLLLWRLSSYSKKSGPQAKTTTALTRTSAQNIHENARLWFSTQAFTDFIRTPLK